MHLAACGQEREHGAQERTRIRLDAPENWERFALMVSGEHWIDPMVARPRPVAAGADAVAGAVAVFADFDGSGSLDPFGEPSAPCVVGSDVWDCRLARETFVIYRVDQIESEVSTRFLVVPHIFASDVGADPDIEACVGSTSGCDSAWRALPWSRTVVEEEGRCADAPAVWLRDSASSRQDTVRSRALPTPRPITTTIEVSIGESGGVRIAAQPDQTTDRQVVWLERDGMWVWSTERERSSMWQDGAVWTADVPAEVLADCPECAIWLGLATHRREPGAKDILEVSELRVDLRTAGYL